jgi:hypothetical protein
MVQLRTVKKAAIVVLCCAAMAAGAPAPAFNTLLLFDGSNGESPYFGPLIQGRDGNLYGATTDDDMVDGGAIFKLTQDGVLARIYVFCTFDNQCSDGTFPRA